MQAICCHCVQVNTLQWWDRMAMRVTCFLGSTTVQYAQENQLTAATRFRIGVAYETNIVRPSPLIYVSH